MKRLFYTGLLMMGLLVTACQKEDIQPNSDDMRNIPGFHDGHNCGDRSGRGGKVDDPTGGTGGTDGGGIVDPNGEEEGTPRPGQHG